MRLAGLAALAVCAWSVALPSAAETGLSQIDEVTPTAAKALGDDQDEATLRRLKEVDWPRAYAQQDVALLDSILAEEFQRIDAEGNWSTKNDELDYVRKNKPRYDSLVFAVKRLDVFVNGTAIVAGEGTVKGQGEGGPYVTTYQSTNIFIKRNGLWKAVASHVSGVKREAARERS